MFSGRGGGGSHDDDMYFSDYVAAFFGSTFFKRSMMVLGGLVVTAGVAGVIVGTGGLAALAAAPAGIAAAAASGLLGAGTAGAVAGLTGILVATGAVLYGTGKVFAKIGRAIASGYRGDQHRDYPRYSGRGGGGSRDEDEYSFRNAIGRGFASIGRGVRAVTRGIGGLFRRRPRHRQAERQPIINRESNARRDYGSINRDVDADWAYNAQREAELARQDRIREEQRRERVAREARLRAERDAEARRVREREEAALRAAQQAEVARQVGPTFSTRLEAIEYAGEIPERLRCPISLDVMNDPITLRSGKTYDRAALREYVRTLANMQSYFPCPITKVRIPKADISETLTNTDIKEQIEDFVKTKEAEARQEQAASVSSSSLRRSSDGSESLDEAEKMRRARLKKFAGEEIGSRRRKSSRRKSGDGSPRKR